MSKIAYLGAGAWGFCLSTLLAKNGHDVVVWARDSELVDLLQKTRTHPKLPGAKAPQELLFTHDIEKALKNAEFIVESVTSQGIRPIFQEVLPRLKTPTPIILTSKGIEPVSGFLLPEILSELAGDRHPIGCLSGPSLADEVIRNLPTSVICSAYDLDLAKNIQELFTTPTFRIYPNMDINGVCFGGAMKNIMAIACGIADGLGFGDNTKAALMTRGLHEMRKLCVVKQCKPETLNGLSGLGDLCVTCLSLHSRNYQFGRKIAEGFSPEGARQIIGMAVEGISTCVSARQLGQRFSIPLPITEATYSIIYERVHPLQAVQSLLQRSIKEEHL